MNYQNRTPHRDMNEVNKQSLNTINFFLVNPNIKKHTNYLLTKCVCVRICAGGGGGGDDGDACNALFCLFVVY